MIFFEKDIIYTILSILFLTYYFSPEKYDYIYNQFLLFITKKQNLDLKNNAIVDSDSVEIQVNSDFKLQVKYEDKYLDDIKNLSSEFVFDDSEKELEMVKINEFFLLEKNEYYEKINEIKTKMGEIETQLSEYKNEDYCNIENYCENDINTNNTNENIIKNLTEESLLLENSLSKLYNIIESSQGLSELNKNAEKKAKQFVIDVRLDKLKNNFIMEKTPLGNVLMLYNNKRGSFEYYSDNTIPYRFLETAGRKYIKIFNCRQIYYDMEEELKKYENKLKEKENEEKEKEEKKKQDEEENKKNNVDIKKNVFAKFKSYNKEAGTGHVNTGAPPKNSIPNNKVKDNNTNEKILLKENANRYSYEGKLSNFNFLKKIDRKVVDKKYAMTFADFKRLQEEKINK